MAKVELPPLLATPGAGPYSVHRYSYNGETWWHVSRPSAVYVETEYKTRYSEQRAIAVCAALNALIAVNELET